jgi:hypothetical protein
LLQQLEQGIKKLLAPPPNVEEQRVQEARTQAVRKEEQRVIDNTPIVTIPQITDAPNIMQSRNPTAKGIKIDSKTPQASHKEKYTWDSTCAIID